MLNIQLQLRITFAGLPSVDNTIMDLTGAGREESSRSVPSVSASHSVSFSNVKVSASSRDSQWSASASGVSYGLFVFLNFAVTENMCSCA